MTKNRSVSSFLLILTLALLAAPLQGQTISEMWHFLPKSGSGAAFEEALKAHIEYRKSLGDPWTWDVFQEMVGPNPGKFYVASWGHEWADLDAYDAWENGDAATAHFQATAAPLLEEMSNEIMQEGPISRMPDDPDWSPSLVNVSVFYLNPAHQQAFQEAIMQVHEAIEEADMPFYYGSDFLVAGGTGPVLSIAGFGQSWADFADPDPNMEQVMVEMYGEEEAMEIFATFSEAIHHWDSFIVRHRPDLTGNGGM